MKEARLTSGAPFSYGYVNKKHRKPSFVGTYFQVKVNDAKLSGKASINGLQTRVTPLFCERRQTALQKAMNCNAKGHLSEGERWPFGKHKNNY